MRMVYAAFSALLVGALCAQAANVHNTHAPTTTPAPDAERLKKLESVTEQLGRQLMLQQLYVEEKARSEGDTGLKQIRMRQDGTEPYDMDSYTGHAVAALHDHSNLERTCGMGELVAVLNGVEFRTRHNDYKLKMPATNKTYNMVEDIPFPEVPPSVLQKSTIDEQGAEMREYFKAWRDANHTHRDYRPYFKPVLCLLEGAWTLDKNLEEPFVSDRHAIEASSWFDLQEKIRFTSMTGDRLNTQNYAYLPTTIINVTDGIPTFAQWNYRIVCHPLTKEVNMSQLIPIDELSPRMQWGYDKQKMLKTRIQRFRADNEPERRNRHYQINLIDEWMSEIPGKDNYGSNIVDDSFGLPKLRLDNDENLNVGHYHRRWKVGSKDAMGDTVGHRGFADRNLFVAENTQPRIAPTKVSYCQGTRHNRQCDDIEKRMSYAFPLELVFLTPLQTWNPYNIENKGKFGNPTAASVTENSRSGGTTLDKAYNGTHSKAYYYTPVNFFSGAEVSHDPADTTKAATGVLDRAGVLRLLKSSGVRILLPNIAGVGTMRTRYPLMPVHAEGSPIWKEMQALRDLVLDLDAHKRLLNKVPQGLNTYTAEPSHHRG